ncbi:MFS general substrate transporter [Lophiostoma macrostomum CBS 122681]|uniref:MFS general substrate transporter n=1 Tax=Lophiostoma macrostomum CBS 122681 TaxID=1314788 RepID=A0A6A6T2N8_9PLEO|nr:MFS general substrate transporter [Lophiostoma macrostomum CBS 122681]
MFGRTRRSHPKDSESKTQFLSGVPLLIFFGAICLTAIQTILDMTILGTAIPSITTYFGTLEDVDWYSTAYMLALLIIARCAIQPLTGQLYILFRSKITFLIFLFVFGLGTLVSAVAKNSKVFIVGRAIAGLGGAGLFNGTMVMIMGAVPPQWRPQFLSVSMVMVGIGGVIGPVVGGAITQHLGWRWCLWIFLPMGGAVALVFVLQHIPDQIEKTSAISVARKIHHKLDFIGFALFTPAIVMLLLGMSWGGTKYEWGSATVIGLLVASVIAVVIFGFWIRHYQDRAMVPPRILLKPVVLYGCIIAALQGGAFLMLQYYLPLWFQSVKGVSPEQGGIRMLPGAITQIIFGIACSFLLKVVPYAPAWSFFGNASVAIGSGLLSTFEPNTSAGKWIGYQILIGIGRGITLPMPVIAAQAKLPPSEISIVTAMMLFFQYFGGTIANVIGKTIFLNALGPALQQHAPAVDAQTVIDAGATEYLNVVPPQYVDGVRLAYNQALTLTFYLPTACAIIAFLLSWGLGWHKISGIKLAAQPGNEPDKAAEADLEKTAGATEARLDDPSAKQ